MNRNVSELGWPDAPGDQRELRVRYVQGLYHVWGTLRSRHPHVIWQSCLRGLDPQARYQIEGFQAARSGLAWMADGLHIQIGDFESTVRRIQRVE